MCLCGSDRELQNLCSVCFWAHLSMPLVGFLVSGAALESGMQHFVLKQKIMLHLVGFTVFSLQIKLAGGLGGLVHGWW